MIGYRAVKILDGHPADGTELAVYGAHHLFYLLLQLGVPLYLDAGGANNKNKHHFLPILGILFQKEAVSFQSIWNAFAVIEAIHRYNYFSIAQFLPELFHLGSHLRAPGNRGIMLVANADGENIRLGHTTRGRNPAHGTTTAQQIAGAIQKVPDVVMSMKADQIGTEQPLQYFPAPGQQTVNLVGREGYMEEKANGCLWQPVAYQFGQEHKMIILHPENIILSGHTNDGIGKNLVDSLICLPQDGVILHVLWEVVKERPDGLVTESEIEIVNVFSREKHRIAPFFSQFILNLLFFALFYLLLFYTWPSNPEAGA